MGQKNEFVGGPANKALLKENFEYVLGSETSFSTFDGTERTYIMGVAAEESKLSVVVENIKLHGEEQEALEMIENGGFNSEHCHCGNGDACEEFFTLWTGSEVGSEILKDQWSYRDGTFVQPLPDGGQTTISMQPAMELKPTADGKLELCSPGLPVSNWKNLEPGGEYHYDPVKGVVRGSGSVDNSEPTNHGGSSFNFGNANSFAFSSDWITADDLGIFNIIIPLDMNIGHVDDYLQAINLTKLHSKMHMDYQEMQTMIIQLLILLKLVELI